MNYQPDLMSTALKMLISLGVVLGGLLLIVFCVKKYLNRVTNESKNKFIRVLANSYIGVKKNVLLVEVAGSILILGVTSDHISLLDKIEDKNILKKINATESNKALFSFSEQLQKFSSKFTNPEK